MICSKAHGSLVCASANTANGTLDSTQWFSWAWASEQNLSSHLVENQLELVTALALV